MLNPKKLFRIKSSQPARHRKPDAPTLNEAKVFSNRDMRKLEKTAKKIDKLNAQLDSQLAS